MHDGRNGADRTISPSMTEVSFLALPLLSARAGGGGGGAQPVLSMLVS